MTTPRTRGPLHMAIERLPFNPTILWTAARGRGFAAYKRNWRTQPGFSGPDSILNGIFWNRRRPFLSASGFAPAGRGQAAAKSVLAYVVPLFLLLRDANSGLVWVEQTANVVHLRVIVPELSDGTEEVVLEESHNRRVLHRSE